MDFELLMGVGNTCYRDRNFPEALEYFTKALNYAEILEDRELQFVARKKMAFSYYSANNISEALRHLDILEFSSPLDEKLVSIISLKSICLHLLGKFDEAVKKISSLSSFSSPLAQRKLLVNLAIFYIRRNQFASTSNVSDFEKALEYCYRALEITDDQRVRHKIYRNIGICFNSQGKYLDALKSFEQALSISGNEKFLINHTNHEMAYSYIQLNELDKARNLLETSKAISLEQKDYSGLGFTFVQYSQLKFKEGQVPEGENCMHDAIDNFFKVNRYVEIADCYHTLQTHYSNINPVVATLYGREQQHYIKKMIG